MLPGPRSACHAVVPGLGIRLGKALGVILAGQQVLQVTARVVAGEAGGLLCTPTHLLEPEVPWENIEAYVEACREFRLA